MRAVVTHQPVERSEPQIAVARLQDGIDRVLRQPGVSIQHIKAVLREYHSFRLCWQVQLEQGKDSKHASDNKPYVKPFI